MKIAMISSNPHNRIGGTETYARNFIDCFASEHEITEFPIMMGGKEITKLDKRVKIDLSLIGLGPDDLIWAKTYSKKHIDAIYKEFDVVLLNNVFPPKRHLKNKKTVLIQHMDTKFYGFKGKPFWLGVGSFFSWALFGVGGTIGNPFKRAANVVFFDESTECETESNKYYVPLPGKENNYDKKNKKGFVWISRLDNPQKNVEDAIYIANNVKNFTIYGDGSYKDKMLKKLNDPSQYKGLLDEKRVMETLANSKGLILTSNWEGFPFTMVEALHAGTPVFAYDTFSSLDYFKKSGMITIASDREDMVDKLSNSTKKGNSQFARNNLTIKQFEEKWELILKVVNHE